MNEIFYLVLLHKIGVTHRKFFKIFTENKDYKNFYDNLSYDLLKKYDFSDNQIESILELKLEINEEKILKKIKDKSVEIITYYDDNYPILLKEISNPPFLLYTRGKIDNRPKISVVWSRKITPYWEKAIDQIVWELSNYFSIVSGGALWCDTKAHQVSLNNWNKTISVIWTWIDIDYPTSNKKLYDDIVNSGGAIISIFPLWEPWNPYNFPVRNEIVAWLSQWVLIIEAKIKSGTLITANLALDMWKDLFAIPWDFYRYNSEWCNMLIKKSMAKLVTKSEDILEEYNLVNKKKSKLYNDIIFSDQIEEMIYNLLLVENLTIDEIKNKLNIDIATLSFKISMLEINNNIKKSYWWKYEII